MKKIILVLVLGIVLVGCQFQSTGPSSTITEQEIYKGKDGLQISFIENSPPNEVYNDDILPVMLNLENKGAFDIDGTVQIDLDATNFRLNEGENIQPIRMKGKSIGIPEGEKNTVRFMVKSYLFPDTELMKSMIRVIANYPYKTKATINVCIDTDPFSELVVKGIQKACKIEPIELTEGQGAPIAVTKIEPRMEIKGNEVYPKFRIFIENVGQGEVLSRDNKVNIVEIEASLYEKELKCDEQIINIDKMDNTLCYLEKSIDKTQQTYKSLLNIVLNYNYKNIISKEIAIKNKNLI